MAPLRLLRRAALAAGLSTVLLVPLVAAVPVTQAGATAAAGGTAAVLDVPEDAALGIVGPTTSTLARVVHLVAVGTGLGRDSTFTWDLDGDGRYEQDTGGEPSVEFGFQRGGPQTVGVRATTDGTVESATLDIDVQRPPTVGLRMSPSVAGPGDAVTFSLTTRADEGEFRAFTWDVEGVKPQDTSQPLADGRRPGAASTAPFLGPLPVLSTAGTDLAVTTDPRLKVTLPKGSARLGRTIDVVAHALAPDGTVVDVESHLDLDDAKLGMPSSAYPENQVIDCNDIPTGVPSSPCASFSASGDFASGISTAFVNTTPTVEVCGPKADVIAGAGPLADAKITQLKNLPYPSPVDFDLGGYDLPALGGSKGLKGGKEICSEQGGEVQSWDWGDGSTSPGVDGVGHVYAQPGSYTVTMTATVPYYVVKGNKLLFNVKYFTARTSQTITITKGECGAKSLNGFAVRPRQYKTFGCWIPFHPDSAPGTTLYRPQQGYGLDVAGLNVTDVGWVDPQAATIVGGPSGLDASIWGTSASTGSSLVAKRVLTDAPSLVLPAPTYDPTLGASVTALPAVAPGGSSFFASFKGLPVASVQTYLSTTTPPRAVLSLTLPAPMGGNTPPAIETGSYLPASYGASGGSSGGSGSRRGAKDLDPGTDYELDLAGTDLGSFRVVDGGIFHRTAGGWYGGLTVDVDGLGTIDAQYLPPDPAVTPDGDCRTVDGPSGLELAKNGGFVFGGAQATFDPEIEVGPFGLACLAAQGTASPFVLSGQTELSVPVDGPIKVDGCAVLSVLAQGEGASGCSGSFVAPERTVWFRSDSDVRLYDFLTLGDSSVEARISKNFQSVEVEGGFSYGHSPFKINGHVSGGVSTNPLAFELFGGVEVCVGSGIFKVCPDVEGGVTSRGFGACAWVGGFVYRWQGGFEPFFASCDLRSKIGVRSRVTSRSADTASVVQVPGGLSKAAFVVHATEPGAGAPTVLLDLPGGGSILDNGDEVQRERGYRVVKYPDQGVTTVTVEHPRRGSWTVSTAEDAEIETELYTPVREPMVSGEVTGRGATRRLSYDARLAAGDELVVVEDGAAGTRVLEQTNSEDGTVTVSPAGAPGMRTVTAVVLRHDVPYREVRLDRYRAPGGTVLAAPRQVLTEDDGTGLRVSWPAVAGVEQYDVSARTTTGRLVSVRTREPSVLLSGLGTIAAGSVSVSSVGEAGTSSRPARAPFEPVRRVVLHP